MPFSVISNFTFEPQLAGEYATAAFRENMAFLEAALGVVNTMSTEVLNSSLGGGGEAIDLPYFANVASLISRRDLTATTAPSDLDITGAKQRGVIIRRKAGPVKFTEDVFIRGLRRETVEQEIGRQIGNYAALEVRYALIRVTMAALAGWTATPHTMTSVYAASGTKGLLTYSRLHALRMMLGDAYSKLTTVVMHSDVFRDLVDDGLATYKMDTVGGYTIITGLAAALGLRFVVMDEPQLKVTSGSDFKKYYTLVFGPGALACIYQKRLTVNAERRLDFEAPYWRVLANFDFCPHLMGHKYTSATMNPNDATLATVGNWDQALNDHRECLAGILEHNASAA